MEEFVNEQCIEHINDAGVLGRHVLSTCPSIVSTSGRRYRGSESEIAASQSRVSPL